MSSKEVTLADQMADNNEKARKKYSKNNIVPPHPDDHEYPGQTVPGNGIPTLFSSDGTYEPSIDPSMMSQGNDFASTTASSVGESITEASEQDITIDIMKNNLTYCRIHANDIFDNLKLNCEYDIVSNLIHILVQFKDDILDTLVESSDMYPYPLDITIPYDMDPILIYNSRKSVTSPDMSTETTDPESPFKYSFWATENDDELLALVLRDQLSSLDSALDKFNESFNLTARSFNEDSSYGDFELVDRKSVPDSRGSEVTIDWYMDEDQKSYFSIDGDIIKSFDNPDEAQDWFDTIASFNNSVDEYDKDVLFSELVSRSGLNISQD